MELKYLLVHTTYKSLAEEAKTLVDSYIAKELTEAQLAEALLAWDANCPNLLYADQTHKTINSSVIRVLGKRRAVMLLTVLTNAKK